MSISAEAAPAVRRPARIEALHHRPPYLWALVAGIAVFALYAITLARTTSTWDTSEYIATAHILGIPHPPGNPLFVLMAHTWETLLGFTGLSVAVRINLFSAVMSAASHALWFLVMHRVIAFFTPSETVRRVGAAACVAISATAFTVWSQSNVNEKVYTVSFLTIAVVSWLAFLWRDHVEEHVGVSTTTRWHDDNVLVLMVFLLFLSSEGNHRMALLAAPALLAFVAMVKPRSLMNWRLYAWSLAFLALAVTVQLFLPIRSALNPIINEAQPTCPGGLGSALQSVLTFGSSGCEALSASLNREQYGKPPVTERMAPLSDQLANYFQYFDWQWSRWLGGVQGYFAPQRLPFTALFLGLGIFGAVQHYKRDRKSFAYMAILFATLSFGLVFYMNFKYGYAQVQSAGLDFRLGEVRERDYFFLISFSIWGLYAGLGLTALWLYLQEEAGSVWLTAPVLLVALLPLGLNWQYANRSNDYATRNLAYNLLQSVEPYGVLFTHGDNDTFPLWYLQEVEGIRRDVTVIVGTYLNTPWYAQQLRNLTRPCPTPDAWAEHPTRIVCQRPFDPSMAPAFYGNPPKPTRSILTAADGTPMSDAEIARIMQSMVPLPEDVVFEARGMEAVVPGGRYLTPADQLTLTIIKEAWGDRPIFFASTGDAHRQLGLEPFVTRTGLAYKLTTPEEAQRYQAMPKDSPYAPILGAYMDVERHRKLVSEVFQYGDLINRPVWPDDATRGFPTYYANAHLALAVAEDQLGNAPAAERHIQQTERWMKLAQE
ncbi:MAG TPA: DUF2723 domain-containing protein [Longimicrobiaceae bacterium]|nr:DUF2723 domain-containing protein [Longimicrobiaceae bacterium]